MKSILLVDDSKFMRTANEKALSRAGYEVVAASDGEEAPRMAQGRVPDLILLDMLLPSRTLKNRALMRFGPLGS
ncbi:MAG: response regulator [Candidatus Sulfotelmatobacter sp.]